MSSSRSFLHWNDASEPKIQFTPSLTQSKSTKANIVNPFRDRISPISFKQHSQENKIKQDTHSESSHELKNINAKENDKFIVNALNTIECYKQLFSQTDSYLGDILKSVKVINSYIAAEGEIDMQTVTRVMNIETPMVSREYMQDVSTEITEINRELTDLRNAISDTLRIFVCCLEERSKEYSKQLQASRDISNMSIRNALMAERSQFSTTILNMKHSQEQAVEDRTAHLRHQVDSLMEKNSLLSDQLHRQESLLMQSSKREEELLQSAQSITGHMHETLQEALRHQYDTMSREMDDVTRRRQAEEEHARFEAEREAIERDRAFKAQLDSRDSHAEELRRIFDEDRARWEVEAKELRKRLQVQEEKFSEERQKLSNRHAADRSEKEKALQDAELEVVRQSSQVKSEAAERIKHVKEEHRRAIDDILIRVTKERDQRETDHAADLDRLRVQHQKAIELLKSQYEARDHENSNRFKRLQEQEVRRLVGECDRLKRLLARRGVGGGGDEDGSHRAGESPLSPSRYPPGLLAASPPHALKGHESSRGSEMLSDMLRNTPAKESGGINWGALRQSLDIQEELSSRPSSSSPANFAARPSAERASWNVDEAYSNRLQARPALSPVPPPPPNAFNVDLAYESSKLKDSNIGGNAKNIGKYMAQLQQYLEGESVTNTFQTVMSAEKRRGHVHDSGSTEESSGSGEDSFHISSDTFDSSVGLNGSKLIHSGKSYY